MCRFLFTMTLKPRQAAQSFLTLRCIVAAFHPEVSIPRLVMFRSQDQTQDELQSLTHFQILDSNFFNDKDNFNKVTFFHYLKNTKSFLEISSTYQKKNQINQNLLVLYPLDQTVPAYQLHQNNLALLH